MGEEPLPDWLTEMRGQSISDESAADTAAEPSLPPSPPSSPPPPPAPSPPPFTEPDGMPTFEDETEPDRFSQLFADLEPLVEPDEDMVGDLRDQIILSDDDLDDYSQPSFKLPSPIPGLTPPQSLVIALLFFATVALCGCMLLFMTQRMVPPW